MSMTDETQRMSLTPPRKEKLPKFVFISENMGWGCIRTGTELSRLRITRECDALSYGRHDAGSI